MCNYQITQEDLVTWIEMKMTKCHNEEYDETPLINPFIIYQWLRNSPSPEFLEIVSQNFNSYH